MTPYHHIVFILRAAIIIAGLSLCGIASAQDYEVRPMTINSPEADFSGVFNGKDIYFCSNRAKMNLSFDDDSITLYYTDLYQSKMRHDGSYSNPEPLRGNVNTDFNEGHVAFNSTGTRMYYTANLKRSLSNKLEKVTEYKLGIFIADFENGQWVSKGEFPYNAANSKYSVAHPSISANDSILYFCSNMPGGEGNSDIYMCQWENGQWGQPKNLGSKVNTKGNEFFPFAGEFDVLYFSTDGRNDSEGMDIYYTFIDEEEYQKPVRLNNTINSPFDDFAYQERRGVNQGTFSSNRNGEQDDIFAFNKYVNTFKDCHENYEANFCYEFFDETLSSLDSLPIRYEWSMGDGTILHGENVEYCYKNYGKFHIALNVIDTITRVVFKKISETDITIDKQDKPYIITHDTIFATVPFESKVEFFAFEEFEVDQIHWELSDGTKYTGESFMHTFSTPGQHQVKCGISGKRRKNGIIPMVCVYKDLICLPPAPETTPEPLLCCDKREYAKISMRKAELLTNIESKQLRKIYKLVILESKEALSPDNALLTKIDAEITEIRTDSSYQYAIAEAGSWEELIPAYQQLRDEGYTNMYTEEYSRQDLTNKITKIIPRNPLNAIKIHSTLQQSLAAGKAYKQPKAGPAVHTDKQTTDSTLTTREQSGQIEENTLPINPLENAEEGTYTGTQYYTRPSGRTIAENTSYVNPGSPASEGVDTNYYTTPQNKEEEIGYIKSTQTTGNTSDVTGTSGAVEIQNNKTDLGIPVDPNKIQENKSTETGVYYTRPDNKATAAANDRNSSMKAGTVNTDIAGNEEQPDNQGTLTDNHQSGQDLNKNSGIAAEMNDSSGNANSASTAAVTNSPAAGSNSATSNSANKNKELFRIVFKSSEERIPFNDPGFSTVKLQITEIKKENRYDYTVMALPQREDLESLLTDMKKSGFTNARIEKFNESTLASEVVRTGRYISPKDAKRLNVEFSRLADIKFEYNSAEISESSFKNLNYIAAMLKLEEDFTLKVSAHTCSIGGAEYNQKLSEDRAKAVVDYFVSKGINKDRLISHGYGLSKPLETNESEMGRAANRRVEFVIVFQIEK